jgi:ATP-dependent RNA helicase DeaD
MIAGHAYTGSTMTTENSVLFAQLALAPPLLKAITDVGYETASPIQAQSIPPLLEGHDLIGQAQTGTGKTAAFALPALHRLDLKLAKPQVLVLAPTRELAIQVAEAMQTYARHLPGFHVLPIYGGQSISLQLRQLERGVHVVVGTPGRVMDHLRRRSLRLDNIQSVVLDEADEMLRMGFIEDVDEILSHTPESKQVALFSATMPREIRRVAETDQRYWMARGASKLDALTRMLEVESFEGVLVFVRTKIATAELSEKLEARGYSCAALNGDLNQAQREKTVDRLKRGSLDIVVATDVAARGLDVERISHVINYDIPSDIESYIHRIGRTGRAGRKGSAILFVTPREQRLLRAIEKATRQPIKEMSLPSTQDVSDRRVDQFKGQLREAMTAQDLGFFKAIVNSFQHEDSADAEDIAAALVYLLQRERPLFPVPEKKGYRSEGRGERHERSERPARSERPDRSSRHDHADRSERAERPDRQAERPQRAERPKRANFNAPPEEGRERFRIEVGHEHGVMPKNIVGAIANEAGIESRYIGPIEIMDSHTFVDLPDGMPKDLFKHLKGVWVCGQKLQISRKGDAPAIKEKPKRDRLNLSEKPKKNAKKRAERSKDVGKRKPKKVAD